ncbi:MAG: DUF2339 domain-containing protein [Gemmatimonadales bacterium]
MDSSRESDFDARLAKIEKSIAAMQRSINALLAQAAPAPEHAASEPPIAEHMRDPLAEQVFHGRRTDFAGAPSAARSGRNTAQDVLGEQLSGWFSSRTPEWWLSRFGIGFVILAVLLLYSFAIDKGWITPTVRVAAGTLLGGILFLAGNRTKHSSDAEDPRDLGFRELFFGGGLAIWYVTAYAAAVSYQLISIPTARLAFFALGLLSTWIALEERREIFGFLAVATGFATPFLLPAPATSMTELSLYLGAVTAMGLIIYLMRGWPSIVWITFVAFWVSIAAFREPGSIVSPAHRSISLTILVILAAAAFVRVPALRRQLLLLGSERYTPFPLSDGMIRFMDALDSLGAALGGGKTASDSLAIWVLPLFSPFLAVDFIGYIWPTLPEQVLGIALVSLGAGAFAHARRTGKADAEVNHVEITAAILWTVLGVGYVAPSPEGIPLASFVATLVVFSYVRAYAGARTVAKATIVIALLSISGHDLAIVEIGLVHLRWVLSGIATVGCASLIAQALLEDPADQRQGMLLAFAAYLTGLVVVWRALEPIWAPLVTTSYAILGAALLILSRRPESNPLLRQLGAATMLIVVVRLLLVDLSSVETIWRVLLFLVCGSVFLYTGYRMQLRPEGEAKS